MYAINHAATALVFKKRYPSAPLFGLLVAVQFVEVLWVILNYLGIERTSVEGGATRLASMPYSHSVLMMLVWALAAWALLRFGFGRRGLAVVIGLAVGSHLVLDLATHLPDMALAPGLESVRLGSGLYGVPVLAFAVETVYGVGCWWVFKGSRALLAAILINNLVNLPLFIATGAPPDPNGQYAATNLLAVSVVGLEIAITWGVVWFFGRGRAAHPVREQIEAAVKLAV